MASTTVDWLPVIVVIGTAVIGALGAAVGFKSEYAPKPSGRSGDDQDSAAGQHRAAEVRQA